MSTLMNFLEGSFHQGRLICITHLYSPIIVKLTVYIWYLFAYLSGDTRPLEAYIKVLLWSNMWISFGLHISNKQASVLIVNLNLILCKSPTWDICSQGTVIAMAFNEQNLSSLKLTPYIFLKKCPFRIRLNTKRTTVYQVYLSAVPAREVL